ncbi:zf-HC2 domain-containing protein [Thermodesulfobacteriota bacterium]
MIHFEEVEQVLGGKTDDVAPRDDCPTAEMVGAYIDGTLQAGLKIDLEDHILRCDHCLGTIEIVCETARADEATGKSIGFEKIAGILESLRRKRYWAGAGRRVLDAAAEFFRPPQLARFATVFTLIIMIAGGAGLISRVNQPVPSEITLTAYAFLPPEVKGREESVEDWRFNVSQLNINERFRIDAPILSGKDFWSLLFLDESGGLIERVLFEFKNGHPTPFIRLGSRAEKKANVDAGRWSWLIEWPAADLLKDHFGIVTVFMLVTDDAPRQVDIEGILAKFTPEVMNGSEEDLQRVVKKAGRGWLRNFGIDSIRYTKG